MKIYFAPIQGHTDAAYRHFHAEIFPGKDIVYTTPFIRLERGEIRKKDLKDAFNTLNDNIEVVPQVIFRNGEELETLVKLLKQEGAKRIDINMGCPFPLQVSKGRGAATIANPECGAAVKKVVENNPDITFSVKMRLGKDGEEWESLIDTLNNLNLDHIAVHPRTSKDQYTPDTTNMDAFRRLYAKSKNPIVYNGDILTPEDAVKIMHEFPELHGIMIGRGALGRPSILKEIEDKEEWDEERRLTSTLSFHKRLLDYYRENLIGGDHQVLSKILPFWEYSEQQIGRKAWKAIKKASTMAKYQTALTLIKKK